MNEFIPLQYRYDFELKKWFAFDLRKNNGFYIFRR
jgi:hypothetical protein